MKPGNTVADTAADPTLKFSTIEVEVTVYYLVFDFNAIAEAERITGCDLLTGQTYSQTASWLRALLYAALLKVQPEITIQSAGSLLAGGLKVLPEVRRALSGAYKESMPPERQCKKSRKRVDPILSNRELWEYYWSSARVILGLTNDQFFRLTPRQHSLLIERHHERVQQGEYMLAQIAAAVINYSPCHPEKMVKIQNLMPSSALDEAKQAPKTKSRRMAVASDIRAFFRSRIAQQK